MQVTKTPNAESPLVHGETPLLTMDVWEHACRHPTKPSMHSIMTSSVAKPSCCMTKSNTPLLALAVTALELPESVLEALQRRCSGTSESEGPLRRSHNV